MTNAAGLYDPCSVGVPERSLAKDGRGLRLTHGKGTPRSTRVGAAAAGNQPEARGLNGSLRTGTGRPVLSFGRDERNSRLARRRRPSVPVEGTAPELAGAAEAATGRREW